MKKKVIFSIIIALVLIFTAYLILSIHVSDIVLTIVRSSYDNYGRDNPLQDIVSDDIYKKMCYRDSFDEREQNPFTQENHELSFPLTYFAPGNITTVYRYSYEVQDKNGEIVHGSWNNPVYITLHLEDGKWVIDAL